MSGGASPRRKGNVYERELVNQALDLGLPAERAYGSNGRALGMSAQVDLVVAGRGLQAKRKKRLASWITSNLDDSDVYGVVTREDQGRSVVVLEWTTFLALVKLAEGVQ